MKLVKPYPSGMPGANGTTEHRKYSLYTDRNAPKPFSTEFRAQLKDTTNTRATLVLRRSQTDTGT
jgi:hypothetical protein